jgi:hypothetical protein
MSFKQHIAIAAVLALTITQAHAQLGAGHGARAGSGGAGGYGGFGSSSAQGSAQGGSNGGRYQWVDPDWTPVDQYQPWRQKDMQQFQKP